MKRSTIVVIAMAAGLAAPASGLAQRRSDGERGNRPRTPPPEAIAACEGRGEGAPCQFDGPRGEIMGKCRTPPEQEVLACVPSDHERRGGNEDGSRQRPDERRNDR